VAGDVARCEATSGPDADVDDLDWRVLAAADVLAGPTVAHALPEAKSQAVRGVGGGSEGV